MATRAKDIAGGCRRLALRPLRIAAATLHFAYPVLAALHAGAHSPARSLTRTPALARSRALARSLSLALSSQVYIGPNVVAGYTHPETGKIVKDQAEHAQVMAQMASVDAGSHAPV